MTNLLSCALEVYLYTYLNASYALSTLTLLVWWQEGNLACKKGGWWRWALVSPDGLAPSQMVGVSASVNLPLHHKVQTEVLFWHRLTWVVPENQP